MGLSEAQQLVRPSRTGIKNLAGLQRPEGTLQSSQAATLA